MGLPAILRPWEAPSAEASGDGLKNAPVDKDKPLISIIRLLRPERLFTGDQFGGGVDLVCMVLACVSRWKEMSIATTIGKDCIFILCFHCLSA
eukprot:SAG22_NODE_837_length_6911_cov_4.576629_5_plen_93_part_00